MSGSCRSSPAYLDPATGDAVRVGSNTYRVTGRGVADSVRFVRTTFGGLGLRGQKSLPCWRRLIEQGEVVATAPR